MDLNSYTELLQRHDWHYQNSDDHRYYVSGKESERQLTLIAQAYGTLYQQAFNEAYVEFHHGGNVAVACRLPFPSAGYPEIDEPF